MVCESNTENSTIKRKRRQLYYLVLKGYNFVWIYRTYLGWNNTI